jgi:hypothetical protein
VVEIIAATEALSLPRKSKIEAVNRVIIKTKLQGLFIIKDKNIPII